MRSPLLVTPFLAAMAGCAAAPVAMAPTTPLAVTATTDAQGHAILPAGTEIPLMFDHEVASNKVKLSDIVKLVVARDILVGSAVVIRHGTPATAVVSYRTGKGALGKSAKMDIAARSIDLATPIAVKGTIHKAGKGNGAATVGTALLLGPLAAGVSGTSARFPKGTIFPVQTVDPQTVTVPSAAPAA